MDKFPSLLDYLVSQGIREDLAPICRDYLVSRERHYRTCNRDDVLAHTTQDPTTHQIGTRLGQAVSLLRNDDLAQEQLQKFQTCLLNLGDIQSLVDREL